MKNSDFIARVAIIIDADRESIWRALTSAEAAKIYMFGTTVKTDWKEGSSITWEGNWKGNSYKDKGTILKVVPLSVLSYTHFSPLGGEEDKPGNYHTVTIFLSPENGQTKVVLTQDGNQTEASVHHSESNWKAMLTGLKKLVEKSKR